VDEPTLETNGPQSPPAQSDAWSADDAYRYLTRVVSMQDDLAIYELNQKLEQGRLRLHWRRTDSAALDQEGDVPSVSWQSRLLCVALDCNCDEIGGPIDWATGKITAKKDGRAFVQALVAGDRGHTYDLTVSARDVRMLWSSDIPATAPTEGAVASAASEPIKPQAYKELTKRQRLVMKALDRRMGYPRTTYPQTIS
jgi:hypothetical protein